jgi:hypothetical protein
MCKNIFVVAAAAKEEEEEEDNDDDDGDEDDGDDDDDGNNNNFNSSMVRNTFLLQNFHMFSGVWTAFYLICTWVRARTQSGRSMKLTIYFHPFSTLRTSGTTHLLTIYVFTVRTGGTLLFTQ